jgi:hypothetical protein
VNAAAGGDPDLVPELTETLRLVRSELKFARGAQEAASEKLQRVRRQRAALREQVRLLSDTLAAVLSEQYWEAEGRSRNRLRGRSLRAGTAERELVSEVEASEFFDGGWYLRQHPDAVARRLSPALHYLRVGSREGAEPGPSFDTQRYLRDNPAAKDSYLPPLLHHRRHSNS